MANNGSFLGTGWSFPPTFTKSGKYSGVAMVSDEEDIKQSLQILLSTSIGERIMQPKFGANLEVLLFESIDLSLESLLKDIISSSILEFEPRIEIQESTIDTTKQADGIIYIQVDFIIISVNKRTNIVFPYFINEGTDLV